MVLSCAHSRNMAGAFSVMTRLFLLFVNVAFEVSNNAIMVLLNTAWASMACLIRNNSSNMRLGKSLDSQGMNDNVRVSASVASEMGVFDLLCASKHSAAQAFVLSFNGSVILPLWWSRRLPSSAVLVRSAVAWVRRPCSLLSN